MQLSSILFIIDHLKGGGAEQMTIDLVNALADMDYQVTIAMLDGSHQRMKPSHLVNCIDLSFNPVFFQGDRWKERKDKFLPTDKTKIKKLLNDVNPDLIVLTFGYAYFVESVITGNIWYWVHGDLAYLDKRPTKNLFRYYKEIRRLYYHRKYFKRLFDGKKIIVVNQDIQRHYQKHLLNADVYYLPNGIDEHRLLSNIDNTLSSDKKWDCIFVGRLSKEKQPEHAIIAFAKSTALGRMAIVGDGDIKEKLSDLCCDLGVQDRVDFLGWQNNPYLLIGQSKVLVVSSVFESFGLVIAEALMMGVPVVSYDLSDGVRYQLSGDRLSQGLVENQNIEKLSQKLGEIIKNPYPIYHQDIEKLSLENMAFNFIQIINESPQD